MSIGSLWDKYFIKDEATYHVFHVTFMDDSMPSFQTSVCDIVSEVCEVVMQKNVGSYAENEMDATHLHVLEDQISSTIIGNTKFNISKILVDCDLNVIGRILNWLGEDNVVFSKGKEIIAKYSFPISNIQTSASVLKPYLQQYGFKQ